MRLVLRDVSVSFGTRELFSGITFEALAGTSIALMGPSGAGKSTLLSIIAGFTEPTAGSVEAEFPPGQRMEYLLQSSPLLTRRTAVENAALAVWIAKGMSEAVLDDAAELLMRLGLGDHLVTRVHRLSGGERQRVAVARAVLTKPGVILADEPTASLDMAAREAVMNVVLSVPESGGIAVIATHDPAVAARCSVTIRLAEQAMATA